MDTIRSALDFLVTEEEEKKRILGVQMYSLLISINDTMAKQCMREKAISGMLW